jgi:hypothetical protein
MTVMNSLSWAGARTYIPQGRTIVEGMYAHRSLSDDVCGDITVTVKLLRFHGYVGRSSCLHPPNMVIKV